MTNRSVEIQEVRLPIAKIAEPSSQERHTYYMLGHMFNELMCLQKLASFTMPKHKDRRPARIRPELSQTMLIFRLASSKLWEAIIKLRRDEIRLILAKNVLPKMSDGTRRWKDLNDAVNSASWLKVVRDGIGFHFPEYKDWTRFITPNADWVDDVIFVGERSGNTFYDAADNLAQVWMFGRKSGASVTVNVAPMINQMLDLLHTMNSFLEDSLGIFIAEFILESKGERTPIGKVIAPEYEDIAIPFWTAFKQTRRSPTSPSPSPL